jgi:hypothetical protein
MKCTTKKEASRIAFFGARKMDAQGYTYQRLDIWNWWVSNPSGGGYNVAIFDSGEAHCGCPFFDENSEFGTCKHIARVQGLKKDEEAREEQQAFEDRIALEAETRMSAEGPTGCVNDKWRAVTTA